MSVRAAGLPRDTTTSVAPDRSNALPRKQRVWQLPHQGERVSMAHQMRGSDAAVELAAQPLAGC